MKILVTGCAGFIGMHTASRLLREGNEIVGVDNLNDYYDVQLKKDRLDQLSSHSNFTFARLDITDQAKLEKLFREHEFQRVIHLAAQPGVRHSLKNPHIYVQSNVVGFLNVLECCRHHKIEHLIFASSSSVYGANSKIPYSVDQNVDHPVSLYAATKKSGELMAHSYSHLYALPITCLRFFTVYGPWGRPDMSPSLFASAIAEGRSINVFNNGKMQRDFTYVDDVVEGVVRVLHKPAKPDLQFDAGSPDPSRSYAPFRVCNIGNHQPVELLEFIKTLERALGKSAQKNMLPMQAGDVVSTFADTRQLREEFGFSPSTSLTHGLEKFTEWFTQYYGYDNASAK
ncbi:MAG: NAD-dependent epimerase [Gallionella sp.]|nr:NAD-dependent epimerase [Gallionella sp.]